MTGSPHDGGVERAGFEAPSPGLAPGEVLGAVLRALADDESFGSDHGVRVLHAFASDRMRAAIGDLDAFRRALRNALYAPLSRPDAVGIDRLERRGDSARASVLVKEHGSAEARFTVALARARHGDRRGCWLVSGIAREGVDL